MTKVALRYGIILASILALFKTIEYYFFSYKIGLELFVGIISVLFLVIGSLIGIILGKRKQPEKNYIAQSVLSERENDVFQLLIKGYTNQKMADELFVSVNTIKTHIAKIYSKLKVKNRAEAVRKYTEKK